MSTKIPPINFTTATREELIAHINTLYGLLNHKPTDTLLLPPKTFLRTKSFIERPALDSDKLYQTSLTILEKFPLFSDFPATVKQNMAKVLAQINLVQDQVVIQKGQIGLEMYFIYQGDVSIVKENGEVISMLHQDSFFGDIGLLFQEKRTATVKVASDNCTLLMLTREKMESVLADQPLLMEKIKTAAKDRSSWFQKLQYISEMEFGGEFMADIARSDFRKILLFENAGEDFLHLISYKMVPEIYEAGKLIIRKNEDSTALFIILNGAVEVVSDDLKTTFAVMNQGSFFGEVGVLMNTKRTANVRAKTRTTVLKLVKKDLQEVVDKYPHIKKEVQKAADGRFELFKNRNSREIEFEMNVQNLVKVLNIHFCLFKVPMFANCERQVLEYMSSTMTRKQFAKSNYIVRKDEEAHEMYFLTHGTAEIVTEMKDALFQFNHVIAKSEPGSFFGEVGILHNTKRIANVIATTDCVTYSLTRKDLLECLEKYPDALEEISAEAERRLKNHMIRSGSIKLL